MNGHDYLNSPGIYLEIGPGSLKALNGSDTLELALERETSGRLTAGCKERVVTALRNFLKKKGWQPKLRAICAIGARGVLLRRLTVPAAGKEELQRLLLLQIENELPLPPDELAWGYRETGRVNGNGNGNGGGKSQEILVVAAKKAILEESEELLTACGLSPVFTLAALARGFACPQPLGDCAVLDIGRRQSELVVFEKGIPSSVRSISWGGDSITLAIQNKLGIGQDEAEKLKIKLDTEAANSGELGQMTQEAVNAAFDALAASIKANWSGNRLYVSGKTARNRELAGRLGRSLGGVDCERVEAWLENAHSTAIRGIKGAVEKNGAAQLVFFQAPEVRQGVKFGNGTPWKWVARAAVLAAILVLFPYVEAFVLKGRLAKKLAEVKEATSRLDTIDRELAFLEYIKQNTPPYLDAMYVMANATGPGTHIDSLNMSRRGEVTLRGTMANSQQVTDFRSKLIKSGFFSTVSVEEQAPGQGQGPDRQKLTVRISTEWKGAPAREALALALGPTKEELEKLKEQTKNLRFDQPPMMGGGPMGMPMGMPPEMQMMMQQQMQPPTSTRSTNRPSPTSRPPTQRRPPMNIPGDLPPGVVIQFNQP